MKRLHLRSYFIGLSSGLLLLIIFWGAKAVFHPSQGQEMRVRGDWQGDRAQFQQNGMWPGEVDPAERLQRMAERFGLSIEELEAELDAGKSIQDIAAERGVELRGRRVGSGAVEASGTGTDASENVVGDEQVPLDEPLP